MTDPAGGDPTLWALVANRRALLCQSQLGEIEEQPLPEAAALPLHRAWLVCHRPSLARRLGAAAHALPEAQWFDLLELYAFVRPARPCLPTIPGLATALGLPPVSDSNDLAAQAGCLWQAARALLAELRTQRDPRLSDIAWQMARNDWPWGPQVLAALGSQRAARGDGYHVWQQLAEWQDSAGESPPRAQPVPLAAALARLEALRPEAAEARPGQRDYCAAITRAFAPPLRVGEPVAVLAEAGTGIGKTIGYIAPASVWAEQNGAPVWLSTYTRNLQRQIDQELDRLYPERKEKARRVVVRKGRENYLCLLNFEEAVRGLAFHPRQQVALGLVARWIQATRDGDLVGGDFPAWLPDLLAGPHQADVRLGDLTDRRGDCIYAACPHYRRCFIERQARRARRADLVIANHALVMVQSLVGGDSGADFEDSRSLPLRYVFDEGHHLFEAADSAFAAHLTAQELLDLRRWLTGDEGGSGLLATSGRAARRKGLAARIGDLDPASADALGDVSPWLRAVQRAAQALPGGGWQQRLASGLPQGAAEAFLALAARQVYARSADLRGPGERSGFSIECDPLPLADGLEAAAADLLAALHALLEPLEALRGQLDSLLGEAAEQLDSDARRRLMALRGALMRRALPRLRAWRQMLIELAAPPQRLPSEGFVDWFMVERHQGRDVDVGYYRHWIDPTRPFMAALAEQAQGFAITSATLRDGGDGEEAPSPESASPDAVGWQAAERRTGLRHLAQPSLRVALASPFDYAAQTRLFIVNDLDGRALDDLAGAYRGLFEAAGGGALGLFTAVARLKAVHQRIEAPLDRAGIDLLAQHVDAMDLGSLIDLFRAEENSCLLGTDAVRDGVDVPGRALRLIVFDRVPWPRPSIAHRARREAFGARDWDDQLVRLKLRQAFGRLVRRADDRGVFLLLDSRLPSRLLDAFPAGVTAQRVGLAEAIAQTRSFL